MYMEHITKHTFTNVVVNTAASDPGSMKDKKHS